MGLLPRWFELRPGWKLRGTPCEGTNAALETFWWVNCFSLLCVCIECGFACRRVHVTSFYPTLNGPTFLTHRRARGSGGRKHVGAVGAASDVLLWPRAAEPREFCGLSMRVTFDHLRSEIRCLIKWHAATGRGGGSPVCVCVRACARTRVHVVFC